LIVRGRVADLTRKGNTGPDGNIYSVSDRDMKTAFQPVDAQAVLNKVAALPIETWQYIGDRARHIGPMAQDFAAAFGVGDDDRHIGPVDAGGVALTAAQALYELIQARDREIRTLRMQLEGLTGRLEALESRQPAAAEMTAGH
jgi:hypothetical protein